MRFKPSFLILASLLVAPTACNKGGKSEGKDAAAATPPPTECDTNAGKIVVAGECKDQEQQVEENQDGLQLQGGTLEVAMVQAGKVALTTGAGLVGQADETQLKSLKYRFTSIQICKSMEVNGTGFSNPTDCLEIYKGPEGGGEYGNLPPTLNDKNADGTAKFADQAALDVAITAYTAEVVKRHNDAKTDTNYIDLMNPEDLKKLAAQLKLTGKDAHEYNFGLVNWMRPIKVTAEVPMFDGNDPSQTILYTKDGVATVEKVGADQTLKHVTNVANLTSGPATEAIIEHPNGGSWFHFPKPFVITADDIKNKTNFKLDLTFNPDDIVQGFDSTFGALSDPTHGYSIQVPMLHLTPIAHSDSQKVLKETYHISRDVSGSEPLLVRVELYSLKGDAAKTVYGVDSQVLYQEGSTQMIQGFPQAFFLTESATGVTLEDDQSKPFLTMPRLDAGAAASTASIISTCTNGHPGFMLPEYSSLNCSDPDMHKEDDVVVNIQGIVELP